MDLIDLNTTVIDKIYEILENDFFDLEIKDVLRTRCNIISSITPYSKKCAQLSKMLYLICKLRQFQFILMNRANETLHKDKKTNRLNQDYLISYIADYNILIGNLIQTNEIEKNLNQINVFEAQYLTLFQGLLKKATEVPQKNAIMN